VAIQCAAAEHDGLIKKDRKKTLRKFSQLGIVLETMIRDVIFPDIELRQMDAGHSYSGHAPVVGVDRVDLEVLSA